VGGVILFVCGVTFITMVLLGNWQVRRLHWKLDLIEAVDTRKDAAPVAAPNGPVTFEDHAYLRVEASGIYEPDLSVRVKALTDIGAGSWLLTPLKTDTQYIWINRGFVRSGADVTVEPAPLGLQTVTGLLRLTEPDGTLLESNDPEAGRWYSRDVVAFSEAVGITGVAPYFIDEEAYDESRNWPRPGLTVVQFRNSHLQYALTWYAMALLFFGGLVWVIFFDLRR
jgi:surfeit locus 1 family protein